MRVSVAPRAYYVVALGLASSVSALFLLAEWLGGVDTTHVYLLWNLFLAWIPFGLALWLRRSLRHKLWSSWEALALSAAWLVFLPNSFYMVSDFIHLHEVSSSQALLSSVTFTSFIFTGVMLGISSLYLVHLEFLKRLSSRDAGALAGILLLASSVAIYIGRDLRWNTWDVLVNPMGLLFDLSERLLHPSQYAQVLAVVVPFFLLLSTMYFVTWQAAHVIKTSR